MSAKSIGTFVLCAMLKRRSLVDLSNGRNFKLASTCGCSRYCTSAKSAETDKPKATDLTKHTEAKSDISTARFDEKSFAKGLFLNRMRMVRGIKGRVLGSAS